MVSEDIVLAWVLCEVQTQESKYILFSQESLGTHVPPDFNAHETLVTSTPAIIKLSHLGFSHRLLQRLQEMWTFVQDDRVSNHCDHHLPQTHQH